MRESRLELSVGDVIQIGKRILTVIDIEDGVVSFRVDELEGGDPEDPSPGSSPFPNRILPR